MTGPDDDTNNDVMPRTIEPERVSLVFRKHMGGLHYRSPNPLFILLAFAVFLMAFEFTRTRFGRLGALPIVGVVITVGVIYGLQLRRKYLPKRLITSDELASALTKARLVAEGKIKELSYVADIDDVPFEPIIVERQYAASSMGFIIFVGLFLAFAVQFLFDGIFGQRTSYRGIGFLLGFTLVWIPARIRPLYYRLVPGRMDLLRFSMISGKARLLKRIDLGKARIRVSFAKQSAEIRSSDGDREDIRLWALAEPHEFIRGLFQAAICTHPAPPLPDDQLLG